jgi:hypothetical protein
LPHAEKQDEYILNKKDLTDEFGGAAAKKLLAELDRV